MAGSGPGFEGLSEINTLHEKIAQAVGTVIVQNAPAQIQKVIVAMVPTWEIAPLPCVFVCWVDAAEEQDQDFEGNLDAYPVKVLICDRSDLHDQTFRAMYLAWRKTLMDAFRPLEGYDSVDAVWNVRTKPEVIFDADLPAYQHVVSGFTVLSDAWDARPKL